MNFRAVYDETYSKTYGEYRIDRITEVVGEFIKCDDYKEGLARIKCPIEQKIQKSTWARLIKKVYGTDPLECPRCGADMKILAIAMDPEETAKILKAFWSRSAGLLPILIPSLSELTFLSKCILGVESYLWVAALE